MSKSTTSTFELFQMFPDQETARLYLESRLWPDATDMADFAAEQVADAVKAERERIADRLTLMRKQTTGLNRVSLLGGTLKDYIDELRGGER